MEQQLLELINRDWTSPGLDHLMAAVSSFDLWWPFLAVAGVAIAVFGGFRGRAMLVCLAVGVGITDGLACKNLKRIVGRPRPHEVLADVRKVDLRKGSPRIVSLFKDPKVTLSRPEPGKSAGRSFPSAHTADNFCAAVIFSVFFARAGWLWFLVAALVGYSRVYTGAHWPGDILASAFLGAGIGLFTLALAGLIWRGSGPRWFPELHRRHMNLFAKPE